jgi:hypothetical protein
MRNATKKRKEEEEEEDAIEKKRVFQDFPPSFILRV